jgi:prepilin-type N-terminal cleavage/methylation domain-containing protein
MMSGLPIAGCRLPIEFENEGARLSSIQNRRAFTLIEVMMVVAIIGMIAVMGVPAIFRVMHQSPMRKAVNDVMEICSHARAQAILNGVPMTVVFHPQTREVAIDAVQSDSDSNSIDAPFPSDAPQENSPVAAGTESLNSAQFDDSITVGLVINGVDYTEQDAGSVRFFPNGTSDEMTLLLQSNDETRKITLEVMTGLASVEVMK